MAIVIEDGSGLSTAEAYISVADADAYHEARGNTAWTELSGDVLKEQALRKAADFMVQRYRTKWKGVRTKSTQALDWPRSGVVTEQVLDASVVVPTVADVDSHIIPSNVVPVDIQRANAELALRSISADLNPDLSRADDVKKEKVDVIEVEYKDSARTGTTFKAVDDALGVYLKSGVGGTSQIGMTVRG